MNFFNVTKKKNKKLCNFGYLTIDHLTDINGKIELNKVNS